MLNRARALRRITGADDVIQVTLDPDALIRQVARGDHDAFALLYDRIGGSIFGIALRVLRDHTQAEEVAQDVLLEIWLKAGQFTRQDGKVMPWAMTIAHRRAIDRVRREKAATDRENLAHRLEVRRPVDDVVETALANLQDQQIRSALDSLSDLQRQSITLAYYAGYSYREVSEALDAPIGTVKTRMRDGLLRLRECLMAHS